MNTAAHLIAAAAAAAAYQCAPMTAALDVGDCFANDADSPPLAPSLNRFPLSVYVPATWLIKITYTRIYNVSVSQR